jgi:predicted SprT family Zn-dependent metalloprotease
VIQERVEAIQNLARIKLDAAPITETIHRQILETSIYIKSANFESIHPNDLSSLFVLYDHAFFAGFLERWVREDGAGEVVFGLSKRMTRAAGHTVVKRFREITTKGASERRHYEIAISTFLLYQNFEADMRPVTSAGLICENRLQALQRTFEHELIHLAEFLAWGQSSCAASNFHHLASRLFGHEARTHNLVTPRELAATTYKLLVGDMVRFNFEGTMLTGRVNRITKRATILCEDSRGRIYSNGRRYLVYYVPLEQLQKV